MKYLAKRIVFFLILGLIIKISPSLASGMGYTQSFQTGLEHLMSEVEKIQRDDLDTEMGILLGLDNQGFGDFSSSAEPHPSHRANLFQRKKDLVAAILNVVINGEYLYAGRSKSYGIRNEGPTDAEFALIIQALSKAAWIIRTSMKGNFNKNLFDITEPYWNSIHTNDPYSAHKKIALYLFYAIGGKMIHTLDLSSTSDRDINPSQDANTPFDNMIKGSSLPLEKMIEWRVDLSRPLSASGNNLRTILDHWMQKIDTLPELAVLRQQWKEMRDFHLIH